MQNHVMFCGKTFSQQSEDESDYCKGWKSNNGSCFGEGQANIQKAFLYLPASTSTALPHVTENHYYSGGGYVTEIGVTQASAVNDLNVLKEHSWIDLQTRVVFVDFMVFNPNSRLFSHVQTVFEILSFGAIEMKLSVTSANLYPYVNVSDYLILSLQLAIIIVVCVRIVIVFTRVVTDRCKYLKSVECFIRISEIICSLAAVVIYILKIAYTTKATEQIFNNAGKNIFKFLFLKAS